MAKLPYFAFYPKDFAGDELVEAMTTVEVGAYILLLCKAWTSEPPASLPNNDAVLARYARLPPHVWAECRPRVLAAFSLGTDNRWHSPRLRREFAKAQAKRKSHSERGKKGASKRWNRQPDAPSAAGPPPDQAGRSASAAIENNGGAESTPRLDGSAIGSAIAQPMAQPMLEQCLSNGSASDSSLCVCGEKNLEPNHTHTKGGGVGEGPHGSANGSANGSAMFDRFWAAYPRKQAKRDARRAWDKLAPDDALLAVLLAALAQHKASEQWQRGIVPNPATWLNGRRWEDEMPAWSAAAGGLEAGFDRVIADTEVTHGCALSDVDAALRPGVRPPDASGR